MSIQFGRWNFGGEPLDHDAFLQTSELTAKYGPDGEASCFCGNVAMLYRPFQITRESWHEAQPLVGSNGVVLTWDGRLDNREVLIPNIELKSNADATDAEIVLAAYGTWGTDCFAKLIGDWALALWDPAEHHLLLAKDFVGVRHLFYCLGKRHITWSTVIDPLVLPAENRVRISEEFIAGYLSIHPPTHLTPFVGINAVPASAYVKVTRNGVSTNTYWSFDSTNKIRYHTDGEYEEHFRSVFAQAVQRRLRSSLPVLAELSGGMDSAAIVCVADQLIAAGQAGTPRLDTISYYDDAEPNWNERPYFSLVEAQRGRQGYHVDVGGTDGAWQPAEGAPFQPLPGYDRLTWSRAQELSRCLQLSESRLLLSGFGGDEFTGGVPSPTPELQDLFVRMRWVHLIKQLSTWSLTKRRPWHHLLYEAVEEFLPESIRKFYTRPRIAPWLSSEFVRQNAQVFWSDSQRTRLTGPLPTFQSCLNTLKHVQRQLACSQLSPSGDHRTTYPYLDRDLLAFHFAVPRQQLVRPHQRRSLMRRALSKLVPAEIFARKRKGFVARHPLAMVESALSTLEHLLQAPIVVSLGWIDGETLSGALFAAKHGRLDHMSPLLGTLRLELWLQTLVDQKLLTAAATRQRPEGEEACAQGKVVLTQ